LTKAASWKNGLLLTKETDPRGFTTRYEYDAFNRLVASTDALGGRTHTVYDKAGQMAATIDALGEGKGQN
jgi:YD repeat-containing protein